MFGHPAADLTQPAVQAVTRWIATAQLVRFSLLPHTARRALISYLSDTMEVWPAGRPLAWYELAYGDVPFKMCDVPMSELTEAMAEANQDLADTFEGYHDLYLAPLLASRPHRGVPAGAYEMWPVILEQVLGDVIQDGMHRFTRYYQDRVQVVTALALPRALVEITTEF